MHKSFGMCNAPYRSGRGNVQNEKRDPYGLFLEDSYRVCTTAGGDLLQPPWLSKH